MSTNKRNNTNNRSNTNGRFADGAFVIWNARLNSQALDPQDVMDMALAAGLPESIVPEYAGDRQIVSRVVNRHMSKLRRNGIILNKSKRTKSHLLMTIHEVAKKGERETELPQTGTVEWHREDPDNEIKSPEGHATAEYLNHHYQEAKGKISGTDWSSTLVAYLVDECYATAWRDDGRVYWVPPTGLDKVRELQDWLSAVGVSLAVAEIDSNVRESVVEVIQASLVDQLDELQTEVNTFNGLQKPSTYSDRLEQYHNLRKRIVVHTETLGIAATTANDLLSQLEDMEVTVTKHLSEREQIRVKRDGTIEYLGNKATTQDTSDEPEDTDEEPEDNATPVFDW